MIKIDEGEYEPNRMKKIRTNDYIIVIKTLIAQSYYNVEFLELVLIDSKVYFL